MSRYAYRAAAAAFGGFVSRPFTEPLVVQAPTFLMPVGGYGSARVHNFRYHEIVSFRAGYTQVIGTEHRRNGKLVRETLASAVVEGLNILDIVTADRVVGRLTSHSTEDATPADELHALPIGSYFENLRIAGHRIAPTCHPHLIDPACATKSAIAARAESLCDPDPADEHDATPLRPDGMMRVSLFEPLRDLIAGGRTYPGCRIHVPSFGDIFLGEYVVSPSHRQLTMLRVELHSPEAGRLACASLEGNGSPY